MKIGCFFFFKEGFGIFVDWVCFTSQEGSANDSGSNFYKYVTLCICLPSSEASLVCGQCAVALA